MSYFFKILIANNLPLLLPHFFSANITFPKAPFPRTLIKLKSFIETSSSSFFGFNKVVVLY